MDVGPGVILVDIGSAVVDVGTSGAGVGGSVEVGAAKTSVVGGGSVEVVAAKTSVVGAVVGSRVVVVVGYCTIILSWTTTAPSNAFDIESRRAGDPIVSTLMATAASGTTIW